MNSAPYYIHTFPNGLRIVVAQSSSPVTYAGVLVNAGSRDEPANHQGLAHFVEHTVFKGTHRRRSCHISSRMESIGGELNAYTTKEETMIYTNAPAGYVARSFELIADLIRNSTFPTAEIEKEKDVIVEEINSYRDSPADAVFDDFEELIYAGSPLAHNILGSPESVRKLSGKDARAFIDTFYTPGNMVIYCSDPGNPEKNIRLAEKYFGDLSFASPANTRTAPPAVAPFSEVRNNDNHQANCVAGTRLFGRTDPRRHTLFLLNNYLGGPCMNSRLNMEMRDRRGLVYTVDSNVALLSDTGTIQFYFGCEPSAVKKCLAIINRELDRIAQAALPERSFARIRDQYCGQLILSGEHRENRAMALAKSLLYFGEVHGIQHSADRIREVTPAQLQEMAQIILSNPLSSLTLI